MKRYQNIWICIAVALLVLLPGTITAEEPDARWDSVYNQGSFIMSPGIGFGYNFSLALYPSFEYIMISQKIDDFMPLDFGISLKGVYNRYRDRNDTTKGWDGYGGGLFGTVHLSFNNLQGHELPFLENFDFYAALGIVGNYMNFIGYTPLTVPLRPPSGVGISTIGGMRYFLLPWLAVNIEGSFWGYTGTAKLAVSFKI